MALVISASPDITLLNFTILYDISGAIPAITLTNASVGNPSGTTRLNQCTWWYVITTPSGTIIHQGSATSPDIITANWTTLSIAPYSWPTIFGNPPCGQVEFSCGVPYVCTLYVKDSTNAIYSTSLSQTICRPNGNDSNTCGSFGASVMSVEVKCNQAIVFCSDTTNYAYQSILQPAVKTNIWTLTYPQDNSGNQPANKVVENTPYVNFPIGYSSAGYRLYVRNYATYDMGNGVTIKIQYKSTDDFAVLCNIDLCKLSCQIQKFYELSKKQCGKLEDPTLNAKMTQINLLFQQALTGIIQPLCGIDVPAIIKKIEGIGSFDENCDCGCTGAGVNLSNPTGGGVSGGCCPVSVDVIDVNTDEQPALCPGSYFPVNVKDPTRALNIGTATNINDLIALLNAYPAWQAYGVAFAEGNCRVGWFAANGTTPIDIPVELVSITPLPPSLVTGDVVVVDTDNPPIGCPSGSPYPQSVYNPAGTLVIGIANSINDLVSILNTTGAWQAYGVASVQDNCHVQWNLTDPTNVPPSIPVSVIATGCTGGQQYYTINIVDLCDGSPSFGYPMNTYVNFGIGGGIVALGYVSSAASLITVLNATPTKPATVTFSLDTASIGVTVVKNTDCTAFSGVITVYSDVKERNYLLIGANHGSMAVGGPAAQGQEALGLRNNAFIGRIQNAEVPWHDIKIGNYLINTDCNTGGILFYDVTNPLTPVFVKRIQLTSIGSTNFTGVPNSITMASGVTAVPSLYSLYFPTDYQNMTLNSLYVVQALSGTIWQLDFFAAPGSEVTGGFQHAKLLGKCPRVLIGNKIWFSQDGDLEQAAGLSSTIAEGSVLILDLATFSSSGFSTFNIITAADEYLWAATFDGGSNIYYIGNLGTLVVVNYTTTVATLYRHILFSTAEFRLNAKYAFGKIYASSLKFDTAVTNTATIIIDAVTRGVTRFGAFTPPGGTAPNKSHYNFIPLTQCVGILTYDGWANVAHPGGGASLFQLDGSYLGEIDVPVGDIYNVIPFPGIGTYSPTTFL